jgi:predicted small lipoprotein YifL
MTTKSYRVGGFLVLAMLFAVLVGCGQKGDLYLPDKSDKSDKKQDFVTR